MKNIKQVLYATAAAAFAAAPLMAGAAIDNPGSSLVTKTKGIASDTGLASGTLFTFFQTVITWLLGLVGVLGVVAFVIAGILYLTSAGNEEQVEKAKSIMLYAIVGIVVALLGLVIINAVIGNTSSGGDTAF